MNEIIHGFKNRVSHCVLNYGLYNKKIFREIGMYSEEYNYYVCDEDMSTRVNMFEEVWSHNENFLSRLNNGVWLPMGGCWIEKENRKIFEKSKMCSFIASNKNITTGHILRQEIRNHLDTGIDMFGRGFLELNSKIDGLKDYMFSIVIENSVCETYFTEKIIDCFVTGTIPIYWGTKKISNYFDENGILFFSNLEELKNIQNILSKDLYDSKKEYIQKNFTTAMENFIVGEEWILKNSKIIK